MDKSEARGVTRSEAMVMEIPKAMCKGIRTLQQIADQLSIR